MADSVPPDGGEAPSAGDASAAAANDVTPAPGAGTGAVAVLDDTQTQLLERLRPALGDALVAHDDMYGTLVVRIRPDAWRRAAEVCRDQLDCDFLSFIGGIDWTPAPREGDEAGGDTSSPVQPTELSYGLTGSTGRFQVLAYVESTSRHWGVSLRTDCDDDDPRAQSWTSVYPGADWHERECWEMYGIGFDGHPNLRHLFLPSDFEGHPLRKDFPLLARVVKPWPGLVDVEPMPGEAPGDGADE